MLQGTAWRRYSRQWFLWRSIYVAFLSALIGIPLVVPWKAQKLWRSVCFCISWRFVDKKGRKRKAAYEAVKLVEYGKIEGIARKGFIVWEFHDAFSF